MNVQNQKIRLLKKHMAANDLLADENIMFDGENHYYNVKTNGSLKEASYIAICNPAGKLGPGLICSYGFLNEKRFEYVSPY